MMANHAARTVIQTVAANRAGGGKTPSSGNRNTNWPSSGPAAPGSNPPSSSPPPAGGGNGGAAPGKTAGAASAGSTSPVGTTAKAPNPGGAPAPATANPGTAQGQSGTPAPVKNTPQEGAAPTRPPLGRGSVFTPPSAGETPGQQGGKDNTPTPSHPHSSRNAWSAGNPWPPHFAGSNRNRPAEQWEKQPGKSSNPQCEYSSPPRNCHGKGRKKHRNTPKPRQSFPPGTGSNATARRSGPCSYLWKQPDKPYRFPYAKWASHPYALCWGFRCARYSRHARASSAAGQQPAGAASI